MGPVVTYFLCGIDIKATKMIILLLQTKDLPTNTAANIHFFMTAAMLIDTWEKK